MATHTPWNQEYNQSNPVRSYPVYVTHINRGLCHTKTTKGEYCDVVPDHYIDDNTLKSHNNKQLLHQNHAKVFIEML